jgi:hypothetical protein
MTKAEKQSWEQERAKGRDRFLLGNIRRGGLPFGILMTLTNFLLALLGHKPAPSFWRLLVIFGFYALFFGSVMGVFIWSNNERDYQEPTEDDGDGG